MFSTSDFLSTNLFLKELQFSLSLVRSLFLCRLHPNLKHFGISQYNFFSQLSKIFCFFSFSHFFCSLVSVSTIMTSALTLMNAQCTGTFKLRPTQFFLSLYSSSFYRSLSTSSSFHCEFYCCILHALCCKWKCRIRAKLNMSMWEEKIRKQTLFKFIWTHLILTQQSLTHS